MPLVELEDSELARLRAVERDYQDAANWRKTWSEVVNDPELKMPAWEIFQKKHKVPVPELDAARAASKPILDKMAENEKRYLERIEALEKQNAERDENQKKENV